MYIVTYKQLKTNIQFDIKTSGDSEHTISKQVGIVSTHDIKTSGDSEHMIPTLVGIVSTHDTNTSGDSEHT